MSFLVASGHVEVEAKTGDAVRDINRVVTALRGIGPAATTAGGALGQLRSRATTAATAVDKLGTKAEKTSRSLRELRAAARDIRLRAELDDQTSSGIATVKAAMQDLKAQGAVNLSATFDGQSADITAVAQAMQNLKDKAQDAAQALRGLGSSATTAGLRLRALKGDAEKTEHALAALRAAARDIEVTARLDDQTTGGAAAVAQSLAALRAASADIPATIDDRTGPGVAAVKAAIQDLKAQGPIRLNATFSGQTADIAAAATAMRNLKTQAAAAGTALTALTAKAAAAALALQALQGAAADASRELRTLRGRAAAAAGSLQDLRDRAALASNALRSVSTRADAAHGRLGELSTSTRSLRTDMDDLDGSLRRVGPSMTALRGNLGTLRSSSNGASGGMRNLMKVALLLSPALIPIAAATVPLVTGLAASAVALGVFGLAIGSQIKDIAEASQALKKYETAVDQHGKTSTEAAKAELEYQRLVKDMPPATREAAAAMSVLKDEYKAWSTALSGDTMPVVTKSMAVFGALLPKLTPLVRGTSTELQRMLAVAAGGIQTPGFDRFMISLADFTKGALAKATTGMVRFTQALNSGSVSSNVNEFMEYVRANGPLVGETLGNLAKAMIHLLAGASEVGVSILTVANALAELVNAVPTDAISTFIQLYAAFKLVKLGAAGMAAVTGSAAAASLSNFVRAARFGGVGSAIAGVTQRMSTMGKVAGGLGILGAVALGINALAEKARGAPPDVDRLTTSLKTLADTGKFTGELKSTFGSMDGFVQKLGTLRAEQKLLGDSAPVKLAEKFGFGAINDTLLPKIDDLVNGTKSMGAVKDDFKSFDQALAQLATGGHADAAAGEFKRFETALRGAGYSTKEINKLFPEYKNAVAGLKAEQALAAQGMGLFGQQAQATSQKLDEQKRSADGLRQSVEALNDANRNALTGMIGFEASIDAAAKAAKENAGSLDMVNGRLDVNSPKAQAAATALNDLATKTKEAALSARENGESWEHVNGIYARGRSNLIGLAQKMGLSRAEAKQLADQILQIPKERSTDIKMRTEDAISGLNSVISAIKKTPNAKSVTVKALTKDAVGLLEQLGFKVKRMPDGQFKVTAQTGTAQSGLRAVQAARDGLRSKSISIGANAAGFWAAARSLVGRVLGTSYINVAYRKADSSAAPRFAGGGRVPRLAGGGSAQYFPNGGYVDGPGTATSDSIFALMGSGAAARVSDTEYVVRGAAVAKYGVAFMDALNAGRLSLPGFAKGGKLTAKQRAAAEKRKQAAAEEKRRQSEGKKALTSDTTFTTGGRLAGYKYTETVHDLGMPDSVGALVTSINTYMSNIKKAFTGKTEAYLVGKLTSSGKALLDNQKKLEANSKALDAAKSTLDDLRGKFDSLKSSVSSSLVSFGNITKIGKYGTSPETLIKQLTSDTSRTTEFSKQLEQLRGKGLNAQAISDIAAAGVTGGGMATAQSLLNATPEQIARINELQKQLQKSADAAGTTAAKSMYGAGLAAAEGVVAGLTAKQKSIEAAMMNIAKSMEKAIKKALGIKSPSKVMESVGDFAFQGIEQGWVKRAAAGATPISGGPTLRATPGIAPSTPSSGGGITVQNLNITVKGSFDFASPGERKAVAKALVKEINDELRTYQRERSVGR